MKRSLTSAINRLDFTISKQNKPNQNDANALNVIKEFVNQQDEAMHYSSEKLFAKLYCLVLTSYLIEHRNIQLASSILNAKLNKTIPQFVDELTQQLNCIEIDTFFKNKGVKDWFFNIRPKMQGWEKAEIIKANQLIYKDKLTQEEFKEIIKQQWTNDEVAGELQRKINDAIFVLKDV
jgi:hypothetical protein